jgi:hypothetical protein
LSHELTERDLLINIRTAEFLAGCRITRSFRVTFYDDVVARTGLNPVFGGQLNERRGPIVDFDLIRSAKNIIVAVRSHGRRRGSRE